MGELELLPAAYAAWIAGDLVRLLKLIANDVVFAVNVPARVDSYVGNGSGKDLFADRLARLLDDYEVTAFAPRWLKPRGVLWQSAHVYYCYKSRATGLECDGTMRHHWRVAGGKIVHLEVLIDAARMDAFRRLTQAERRPDGFGGARRTVRC
jgi:ketosteroid isomerase-like protein